MAETGVKAFFDGWSVYDRLLDLNYMFHDEIFDAVRRLLRDRFGERAFTVLDLGCGSARHVARALDGLPVAHYTGCDLSDVALAHAAGNLAGLGCPVSLHHDDLLEALGRDAAPVDLIVSSYAVHHLAAPEKETVFALAARRLKPAGLLLLVDVTCEEDEDRGAYLDRYCGWIQATWTGVPPEARDAICTHVRTYDFPEAVSTLRSMARRAGFRESREVSRFRAHRVLAFEQPVSARPGPA